MKESVLVIADIDGEDLIFSLVYQNRMYGLYRLVGQSDRMHFNPYARYGAVIDKATGRKWNSDDKSYSIVVAHMASGDLLALYS
jgi:hypothetical protein